MNNKVGKRPFYAKKFWLAFIPTSIVMGFIQFMMIDSSRVEVVQGLPPLSELPKIKQISHLRVANLDGSVFAEGHLNDKVWVINFTNAKCEGVCPMLTHNMSRFQIRFKRSPNVALLSISPEEFNISMTDLKAHADAYGAEPAKWIFTVSAKNDIKSLVKDQLGLEFKSSGSLPSDKFILVDQDRNIRAIYDGKEKKDMEKLSHYVKLLAETQRM